MVEYKKKGDNMAFPKKSFLIVLLVTVSLIQLSAAERIAIMDFKVESSNKSFQYLGKGFAEFVSVELSGTPGLTLVDREKRNAVLDETKFGMSGLADDKTRTELGKLLSVNYLLSGMILDLQGMLVVTCELVSVETGEIIVHEKADGKVSDYDKITKTLADAVVSGLGLKKEVKAVKAEEKPKQTTEKEAEKVLASFSQAVDAYDAGDTETAKKKLEVAASIDKSNKAVKVYMNKLYINTSKFKVVPFAYFPEGNPASLGLIKRDTLGFNIFVGLLADQYKDIEGAWYLLAGDYGPSGDTKYAVNEGDVHFFLKYQFPIGKSLGAGAELFYSMPGTVACTEANLYDGYPHNEIITSYYGYGGIFNLGWTPADWLSLGISVTVANYGVSGWDLPEPENPWIFAGTAGFIIKNSPGSVIFNFTVGASNLATNEIDLFNERVGDKIAYPFYNDMSLTLGFNSMRSFVVLKQVFQIYMYDSETGKIAISENGSQAPYVQLIPVFEQWFTPSFSLRAGPVVSTDYESWGFGGVLGSTITFNKTKELNIGITYRQRPSRAIRAELIPEFVISVGYSSSGLFAERK